MKKKGKAFKIIISIIIIILITIGGTFFTYKSYFAPKVPVTSINSTIEVNPLELALKLIPKNVDFSLGEISANSNIEFTENDLTNFAILAIQQNQHLKDIVTGLKFVISNNTITLYVQFKYSGIPFEAKLNFSCLANNGEAIIHYESGKIGFINIPSSLLFKYLKSNEFINIYPNDSNIALKFAGAKNISINSFKINGNKLSIGLEASLRLF